MGKKLWIATLELEVPIAASTREEAKRVLRENLEYERSEIRASDFDFEEGRHIPGLWEGHDRPYGEPDDGKTIGQYLSEAEAAKQQPALPLGG